MSASSGRSRATPWIQSPPARRADRLYSNVFVPEETRQVLSEAREFCETYLRPQAHRLNTTPESRESFPRKIFEQLARSGLYEIPFPKDVGGRGLTFPMLATMVVLEEIAYFSPGIASALYDAQALLVGQTLMRAGEPLRSRLVPGLVKGEFVGAFATSEPQTSTDLSAAAMQTVAAKVEDGWRINGRKRWITNAVAADFVIVLCRSGESEQSFLLVDTRNNGVTVGELDLKMGNHPQLTSEIHFDNAFAPDEHLIGAPGGSSLAVDVARDAIQVSGAYGFARVIQGANEIQKWIIARRIFSRDLVD